MPASPPRRRPRVVRSVVGERHNPDRLVCESITADPLREAGYRPGDIVEIRPAPKQKRRRK